MMQCSSSVYELRQSVQHWSLCLCTAPRSYVLIPDTQRALDPEEYDLGRMTSYIDTILM